jgi:hypothetical protein
MKKLYLFFASFLVIYGMNAQAPIAPYWNLTPFFTYNILVDGHMNVNDPRFPADKISFTQDIGNTLWSNIGLTLNRTFKNNSAFSLTGEYFFISGANQSQRNIWFNGVLLNSSEEITIDHSRIIRMQAFYEKVLRNTHPSIRLTFLAGLIYDYHLMEITSGILNDTDPVLLHEDFNDQVIPYPQLGGRIEKELTSQHRIVFQAAGTYIPRMSRSDIKRKLETFQYYCFNSSFSYQFSKNNFSFGTGITYRFFRTAEDEGTHDFYVSLLGVNALLTYRF